MSKTENFHIVSIAYTASTCYIDEMLTYQVDYRLKYNEEKKLNKTTKHSLASRIILDILRCFLNCSSLCLCRYRATLRSCLQLIFCGIYSNIHE